VYLITDSASFYAGKKSAIPYLYRSGLPVVEYNPIRGRNIFKTLTFLDRDHRKYWIFDGEVAVVGGFNITNKSLYTPHKGGNKDSAIFFKSEETIKAMVASFVTTWKA